MQPRQTPSTSCRANVLSLFDAGDKSLPGHSKSLSELSTIVLDDSPLLPPAAPLMPQTTQALPAAAETSSLTSEYASAIGNNNPFTTSRRTRLFHSTPRHGHSAAAAAAPPNCLSSLAACSRPEELGLPQDAAGMTRDSSAHHNPPHSLNPAGPSAAWFQRQPVLSRKKRQQQQQQHEPPAWRSTSASLGLGFDDDDMPVGIVRSARASQPACPSSSNWQSVGISPPHPSRPHRTGASALSNCSALPGSQHGPGAESPSISCEPLRLQANPRFLHAQRRSARRLPAHPAGEEDPGVDWPRIKRRRGNDTVGGAVPRTLAARGSGPCISPTSSSGSDDCQLARRLQEQEDEALAQVVLREEERRMQVSEGRGAGYTLHGRVARFCVVLSFS